MTDNKEAYMIDCYNRKCEQCCFYENVTTKSTFTFVCTRYGYLSEGNKKSYSAK